MAVVVNGIACPERPDQQFVGKPMSEDGSASNLEPSVAIGVDLTKPRPALFGAATIDLQPEPFLGSWPRRGGNGYDLWQVWASRASQATKRARLGPLRQPQSQTPT